MLQVREGRTVSGEHRQSARLQLDTHGAGRGANAATTRPGASGSVERRGKSKDPAPLAMDRTPGNRSMA